VIIFSSVQFLYIKIIIKSKFFFKKNQNRFKSIGFGFGSVFLEQKPVQTGLARFWLSFFGWLGFGLVFSVSLGFGSVFSGLARFGLVFQFQTYKTETEPVGFFKILIGFFHGSVFSVIFF